MCPRKSTGKNTRSDKDTLSAIDILRIYERIVSVTEDRLAFVDRDYIYRAANESYLRAFSKKRQEVIGHTVAEVRGEKVFKETLKKHLDRCLNGENVS